MRWMQILWPSFLVAGVAEIVFFSALAPHEIHWFGTLPDFSPIAIYSVGFFVFWALCAASSLISLILVQDMRRVA